MQELKANLVLQHVIPKLGTMLERMGEDAVWQELHRLMRIRYEDKDASLHQRVEDLITHMPPGNFKAGHIFKTMGLTSERERKNVYKILQRLTDSGLIIKEGSESGNYRKMDSECLPMLWADAPIEEYGITLPLGLSNLVKIYPKNVIVIAGIFEAGKTGICMNIVKDNMADKDIKYFNSEMGSSEMRLRLELFKDIEPEQWNFGAFERSENFEDVIDPDALNIIDYMEVHGEFWTVGQKIKKIHDRLRNGIAIIALQKGVGTEYGRGATFGVERPRLYVSLDRQYFSDLRRTYEMMRIKKGKNRRDLNVNPTELVRYYEVSGGSEIIPFRDWHRWGEYDFERTEIRKGRRY